jgi:PAS domain S-box-containing protein
MTLPKRAIPGAPVPSLADLYDHAPVGYITVSTEGVVLAVNDTLLKWTGRLRHELVGHSWVEVLLTHAGQTFFSTHIDPLLRLQGYARELSLDLQCADNTRMATLVYIDRKDHIADVPVFWLTVVEATDRRRYETKLVEARRRSLAHGRPGEARERANGGAEVRA